MLKAETKLFGIRDVRAGGIQDFLADIDVEDPEDIISVGQSQMGADLLVSVIYWGEEPEDIGGDEEGDDNTYEDEDEEVDDNTYEDEDEDTE